MEAIILAAGRGSRLRPISDHYSKGMVPMLGQPFMAWIMADLLAAGVDRFVLVIRPDDQACRHYFSTDERFQGRVCFVEQDNPCGSGDALRRAAPMVSGDVIISACDNLVDRDELIGYLERWRQRNGEWGLLGLMKQKQELLARSGVVAWDGQRIDQIVEKPTLPEAPSDIISLPLYCLDHSFVDAVADIPLSVRGEYEIQVPLRRLMAREPGVHGHLFPRRFTLTTSQDLLDISHHLLDMSGQANFVAAGAIVGNDVTLNGNVVLESGCDVGDGAVLSNVMVLPGGVVPAGAKISNQVII